MTKDELRAKLADCRDTRDGLKIKVADLEAKLAECEGAEPPATPSKFILGVNGGSDKQYELDYFTRPFGWTEVRHDFSITTPPATVRSWVDKYAAAGAKLVIGCTFANRLPTDAECQNMAAWAAALEGRVTSIEWGNESSYSYMGTERRGGEYARSAKLAYQAIAGRCPLWVQADNINVDWTGQMRAAVPDLDKYADGWTVHPYGDIYLSRVKQTIAATTAGGWTPRPVYATEYGIVCDAGRNFPNAWRQPTNLTYQQAADWITKAVNEMKPLLGGLWLYHSRDFRPSGETTDPQHYFGVVLNTGKDKGAITPAVRALRT